MAERRIEHHRMDDIVPADRNPRNHNLPGIRALILRFGFTAPVLRDERTGRLVAGHGRVLALSDLRNDGQLAQLINRHRSGEHVDMPPGITITPDGDWAPNGVGIDHDGGWLVPIVCGEHAGVALPSNVIHIAAAAATGIDHSAQFPVELPAWFIRAYSDPGDVIFDPFMGSGSTLIAAHDEQRVALGSEISPRYVDVICRRFQEKTGILPILATTGTQHDFTLVG